MPTEIKTNREAGVMSADEVVIEEGELSVIVEIRVRRADGSLKEQWAKKAESFTRQFLDLLMLQMAQTPEAAPLFIRDTLNTLRPLAISSLTFATNCLVNDDSFSIVVGAGSTAPTITDYTLENKIAHGSGAGQLQYGGTAYGLPTSNATQSHFTITRDFSNASGADITVNEIGLYAKGSQISTLYYFASHRQTFLFLLIRDVIGGGITIGNGETLTINYRLLSTL